MLIQGNGKIFQINVYVQHQKQSGTKQFNNVNALWVFMVQNANNVHYRENGMITQILVIVQHQ